MPRSLSFLISRRAAIDAVARHDVLHILLVAALHLTALALMAWTEVAVVPKVLFLLTWGLLNFFWLALAAPPRGLSAALSLALIVAADPALAAQIRDICDDRELRRRDDHRSRHHRFLLTIMPPLRDHRARLAIVLAAALALCCGGSIRSACGSGPRPRASSPASAAITALAYRLSARGRGKRSRRQFRLQVRPLGRHRDLRAGYPWLLEADATVTDGCD